MYIVHSRTTYFADKCVDMMHIEIEQRKVQREDEKDSILQTTTTDYDIILIGQDNVPMVLETCQKLIKLICFHVLITYSLSKGKCMYLFIFLNNVTFSFSMAYLCPVVHSLVQHIHSIKLIH